MQWAKSKVLIDTILWVVCFIVMMFGILCWYLWFFAFAVLMLSILVAHHINEMNETTALDNGKSVQEYLEEIEVQRLNKQKEEERMKTLN